MCCSCLREYTEARAPTELKKYVTADEDFDYFVIIKHTSDPEEEELQGIKVPPPPTLKCISNKTLDFLPDYC